MLSATGARDELGAGAVSNLSFKTVSNSNTASSKRRSFYRGGTSRNTNYFTHSETRRDDSGDSQSSDALDPRVIASSFASDGQETPVNGQSPSLTSTNNFINFCASYNLPLTNGQENPTSGTCNPTPWGILPPSNLMPSVKFTFPKNGDIIQANLRFTVQMNVRNLEQDVFSNISSNYLAAPQQLSTFTGAVNGLTSFVIQRLNSLDSTDIPDAREFSIYRGILSASLFLSGDVPGGLPEGYYRISSITRTANFQPVALPVHARGAMDDAVYFTVTDDGLGATGPLGDPIFPPGANSVSVNVSGSGANSNLQTSMTLDSSVIASSFALDGQGPQALNESQSPSLTSTNNFINFCLNFTDMPLTNGFQLSNTSCNPSPMGLIPPGSVLPSAKFLFPKNNSTISPNTTFTVQLNITNMQTGFTVNPQTNYMAAPQTIDGQGRVFGHSHIVIEELTAMNQTDPTDPSLFAFWAELNEKDENGVLSHNVTGLPAGVYRLSSMHTAANHQPIVVGVDTHGAFDDVIYFTVGQGSGGSTTANTVTAGAGETTTISTTTPTATTSASSKSQSHRNVLAATLGGTLSGVLFLVIVVGVCLFFRRRRRRVRAPMYDPNIPPQPTMSQIDPFIAYTAAQARNTEPIGTVPFTRRREKPLPPTQNTTETSETSNSLPAGLLRTKNWVEAVNTQTQSNSNVMPTDDNNQAARNSVSSFTTSAPSYHTHA